MFNKIRNWIWFMRHRGEYRILRERFPRHRYCIWYSWRTGFVVETWESAINNTREQFIARILHKSMPWRCMVGSNKGDK